MRVLKVPEKNGEFFCSHNISDIPHLLKSNQELTDSYSFKIAETRYHQFRKKVETETLNLLTDYSESSFSRPYIGTGHHPGLCHPGIWIKNLLANKLAGDNKGTAFNIIVDSDCPNEIGCYVLTKNEKIERKKEVLAKLGVQQPFECCSVPNKNQFKDFYQNILVDFQSFPDNPIRKYTEIFFQKGESALPASKNIAEFLVKTRKGYEADAGLHYFDIMLSHICQSESFLLFALHIAEDIKGFHEIYNQLLEEYRINHKLRYKVNPFPDLKKDNDKFQIPFWCINDNKRQPVWVTHEGTFISFHTEDICLFRYKKGDFDHALKIIDEEQINLRPKAVLLTLFIRLFLVDIFIHGISGAKYDEITDGIMEKYYKIKPPHYIAASLTLFPDFPVNKVQENDIDNLKRIIRNMKFKPEIFKDRVEGGETKKKFKKLVSLKMELLQREPPKKDRKEHFQRLKIVTEELSNLLKNYYIETKDQLRVLEDKYRENQTVHYREFPYFFYDINKVKGMIK